MLLYIVRHAFAGQHGDPRYPDDSLRPLTKKGRKRFARMVKKLAKRGFAPALVASSPFVRCRQTAQTILEQLGEQPKLMELNELTPGSDLPGLMAWTNVQGEPSVAWVGHAPDVDRLLAALVGNGSLKVALAKGAVAAIEFEAEVAAGQGQLNWLATPKIIV